MEIEFIRSGLSEHKKAIIASWLESFICVHDIELKKCTLDFRKTKNNYISDGLFGGFKDMYDHKKKTMYFNPNNFIEYNQWTNTKHISHLVMHEMIHTKQVQSKQIVLLKGCNKLKWKGKIYDRAPFCVSLFNKIRKEDPTLAEEYHWRSLPWEKDAYTIPERFMEQPLWKTYE